MDAKIYTTLELDKVLGQLSRFAAFSGGEALIAELVPTFDLDEARLRQQETGEARTLLELNPALTLGGARDVRQTAEEAARDFTLTPESLLDIKQTLQAATTLKRAILKLTDQAPLLAATAERVHEGSGLVTEIGRVLSARGEVLDSASERLASIRHELRRAHDRLQSKLHSIVNRPANNPYLQEALVTMRSGRYVIPIKAEHKGRIKGVVHDQSSSGATLFIEPLATVEINNQVRELELAEQEEIRRILAALSARVGQQAPQIIETVNALAELDLAFAKAHYANAVEATQPELVPFPIRRKESHPGSTMRLYNARHPLLDPASVVPIDVELDDDTYALVITGPNTGGKTVSLKTIGLLTLMAQCGLHIPAAEGSALSVFETIYADIGDEQSIEQSLSTFSGHMSNIIPILAQANARSLVILDELGAGTDPGEGSALARAILNELLERGATAFVATHYPELKEYAHGTPGVRNASVQFDLDTLAPTYRLLIGLPGRSNALAIAGRLGLPEGILDEARSMVGEADLHIEDLLDEINRTREEIQVTQERLESTYAEAAQARDELRDRLWDIDAERRAVLEATRQEALAELEAVRAEVADLRENLRRAAQVSQPEPGLLEAVEGQVDALEEIQAAPLEIEPLAPVPEAPEPPPPDDHEVQPGDRVYVQGLDAECELVALNGGQAEVQLGRLRMRVDVDDLVWRASPEPAKTTSSTPFHAPRPSSPGLELHLRGQIIEDALIELDSYLDTAYLSGLPWVRIVHGKGSGKLRGAVQDALATHPLVESYQQAPDREGGSGVTLVQLVPGS
jgi:DNA mismatch repair protein MutS2